MTDTELDEMERMWAIGVPRRLIAARFGYSEDYVAHMMKRHRERFPCRRNNVDSAQKERWVARIIGGSAGVDQVARELGVSVNAVRKWVRDKRKGER